MKYDEKLKLALEEYKKSKTDANLIKVAKVYSQHPKKRRLALEIYDKLREKKPTLDVLIGRANLMLTVGVDSHEMVAQAFLEVIDKDPKNWRVLRDLSSISTWIDPEIGEFAFTNYLKLKPNDWRMHNNFGVFLSNQNRYQETIDSLNKAISLAPSSEKELLENNLKYIIIKFKKE
jgi:tetratricopeptide (TPR) repeat protein